MFAIIDLEVCISPIRTYRSRRFSRVLQISL